MSKKITNLKTKRISREEMEAKVHRSLLNLGQAEREFDEIKCAIMEMEEVVGEARGVLETAEKEGGKKYAKAKRMYEAMVAQVEHAHARAGKMMFKMAKLKQDSLRLLAMFYGEDVKEK